MVKHVFLTNNQRNGEDEPMKIGRDEAPVIFTCVVIFMPTTSMFAPEVNTISAASGSP